MIKIAVCDDQAEQLNIVKKYIGLYEGKYDEEFVVEYFSDPFLLTDDIEKGNFYDVYLLDICMPNFTGTELAKRIRRNDNECSIIFLTTSKEFMLDAFDVNAIHYIVKPYSESEFFEALSRAIKFRQNSKMQIILNLENRGITLINVNKIIFLETHGHNIKIVLRDGQYSVKGSVTLKSIYCQLQEKLPNAFILPFKGYIVNQNYIKTISSTQIILKNNYNVPIKQRSYNQIKQGFVEYIFGKVEGE